MLTKTSLIVFIIFWVRDIIGMSDSKKNCYLKKKQIDTIFCCENEKFGGRGDSGIFSQFLYIYIF